MTWPVAAVAAMAAMAMVPVLDRRTTGMAESWSQTSPQIHWEETRVMKSPR